MSVAKAKRPILAVIVIVIVVVAGVGVYFATQTKPSVPVSSSTASMSSTTGMSLPTTLVVDEPYVPGSMDPGASFDNPGLEIAQNVNLPLVFCANAPCSSLVPVVASSWTSSPDGMTYTFLLRNGVYYNNGDPLNAYVVWWNIYRMMIINQASDFIFYTYFNTTGVTAADVNSLNNPQNMPDANLLAVMENPHNSVTVLNASAVQFNLKTPFVPFLTTIDTAPWVFVDPYVVEQHGGVEVNLPNIYMSTNGTVVGDGPYITQVYLPSQYTILVANPNYWAQNLTGSETNFILQPAKIPRVVVNYKTEELTRALDLESGAAQVATISFDDIPKVKPVCPNCIIPDIGPSGTIEWVAIDMLKAPLDNILLRRAIVAAINVTQIRQVAYSGYGAPVVGPNLIGFQYYDSSIKPPACDVTLAKQLLAEAGYPNGQGLRPLDFYYFTSTYQSLMGQIMKQNLAEIGITLNLHEMSMAELIPLQTQPGTNPGAPDMWTTQLTYYPDFSGYEIIVDSRFGAFMNMHNDTIYNLILKSNTEVDPTARAQEISQVTRYVEESAAIIWIGQDIDTYDTGAGIGPVMFNKCLAGMWYHTAFNGIDFNTVYYSCAP